MKVQSGMRWLGFLLVVGVATGFFVHRVLIEQPQDVTFENSDLLHYMVPSTEFLRTSLRAGQFPTWNPYQFAGQPFAASQITSVFYPPHLLLAWIFPTPWALALHSVLHLVVAGVFSLLLAARLGLSWPAQWTVALGYMLSGAMLSGLYNTPYMATHAWLPALLWALHGLVMEARWRWAFAAAGTSAFAFLGGHAQAFFYEVQLGFLWFVLLWSFRSPAFQRARSLGLACFGALLALALVAPQLFSTLELTGLGNRPLGGHRWADAFVYFYPESRLWDGLRGEPGSGVGLFRWTMAFPTVLTLLAALGVFARGQRVTWLFFGAVALFAALFSLGPAGSVYGFYFSLPGGDLFRGAARISFIYAFSMAVLAGIGVQAIMNAVRMLDLPRWLPATVGLFLAAAVGVGLYAHSGLTSSHPVASASLPGAPASLVNHMTRRAPLERVFIRQPVGSLAPELTRKSGMIYGFFALPDYEPLIARDYETFFAPESPEIWHGKVLLEADEGRPPHELSRVLDLMSVRFIAPAEPGRPLSPGLRAVGARSRVPGTPLARRRSALPRAYTVERVVMEADTEAAIERVVDANFEPDRAAVVQAGQLEGKHPLLVQPGTPMRVPVEVVRYELDEVEVSANCERSCLLVLTDFHYPGWIAEVNGERRPILKTNGIFRGVVLAPGQHRVIFRYEPASIRAGFTLSAALLLVLAMVVVWRSRK